MTREEAKHWLEIELKTWEDECKSKHPIKEAFSVAIETLEQEQILDKIRDEIGEYSNNTWRPTGSSLGNAGWWACNKCIEIIDKYKAESEDV